MGCLTIYTDASYSADTKTAGYGYWARDKTFIAKGMGAEGGVRCSNSAEIRAIAFALFKLINFHKERVVDKKYCTVVTDSEQALLYYKYGKGQHLFGGKPYTYVQALMTEHNITFNVKWVRAHSRRDGARSHVNQVVDKLARRARTAKESP